MALQEEFETQGQYLFRHRGVLPLFILVVGLAAFLENAFTNIKLLTNWLNLLFEIFCLIVSIIGILIRAVSVGFSGKNTSGRNTQKQVADSLNTTGLYSIVRHPLYVANFFMWLGIALLTRNTWFVLFFIFLFWVYYERIMFAEEQFLRRKFGKAYEVWAAKTPAFIPKLQQWKSPGTLFNLKKVIRQEKNGILATAVLFLLFEEIEQLLKTNSFLLQETCWYYLFLAGFAFYVGIKLLVKYTSFLHD